MTASQTGGKKGAWRAGRPFFTRLGSTSTNTKRPFADDNPGTRQSPQAPQAPQAPPGPPRPRGPMVRGLCELLYPRSRDFTSDPPHVVPLAQNLHYFETQSRGNKKSTISLTDIYNLNSISGQSDHEARVSGCPLRPLSLFMWQADPGHGQVTR